MKSFFSKFDSTVLTMAGLRMLSASIEFSAAIVMLILNDVKKAVIVNSLLAIVGPIVFIITMTIGIFHIADQVSYGKLVFIGIGVFFILFGIYK
ncbi:YqhV family protein [Metabacillus fastidiosus]|uniref:YqhV family protein n=1 Tax=Metabacillus fastidiosus TaxID=1458 RepID=A0ABU6NWX1_9BACI|nr:YqhV family protein [Metabacillus fastidiosus]MED4400892.1 YqhV family protein [Metabacillus fastidiosus]MED4453532.1 YqhV family protein [Metabacillus fastidiosus]MED4463818.1 YqhV family protein [Metabacillus fastidiosus]MED4530674.1 YqhV family protein [Metabacillus fastidiosus]